MEGIVLHRQCCLLISKHLVLLLQLPDDNIKLILGRHLLLILIQPLIFFDEFGLISSTVKPGMILHHLIVNRLHD